jgi:hypothetical protein
LLSWTDGLLELIDELIDELIAELIGRADC